MLKLEGNASGIDARPDPMARETADRVKLSLQRGVVGVAKRPDILARELCHGKESSFRDPNIGSRNEEVNPLSTPND
jgi:hypothetical protein